MNCCVFHSPRETRVSFQLAPRLESSAYSHIFSWRASSAFLLPSCIAVGAGVPVVASLHRVLDSLSPLIATVSAQDGGLRSEW